MNLDLTETQAIFRDTVRDYLEREVPFSRIRELEKKGAVDASLWQALVRQGWLGVGLPEARGGGGATLVDAGLLVEEVQRRAALVPIAEVLAALHTLERRCNSERAREFVRQVLAGDALVVPALLEAGDRHDEVASEVDSRGRLTGEPAPWPYCSRCWHTSSNASSAWPSAARPCASAEARSGPPFAPWSRCRAARCGAAASGSDWPRACTRPLRAGSSRSGSSRQARKPRAASAWRLPLSAVCAAARRARPGGGSPGS